MSQYDVFSESVFSTMDDAELAQVAKAVDKYHQEAVIPLWNGIDLYIMDVEYVKETDSVRLIELNSFGAEMASASALFHWVRDADLLHSSDQLCIRVRAADEKRSDARRTNYC
jgi:hypothetical protein